MPDFEISYSVKKIKQRTPGLLKPVPLELLDGYVSPSGGFMNYAKYKVSGTNSATNRAKSITCDCFSEEEAIAMAAEAGLGEPYTIAIVPFELPSDRQIEYAADLGIAIPDGACMKDVSAMIDRVLENDENPPDDWTTKNAIRNNVKFSRYIGRKALLDASTKAILNKKRK